MSRRPFRRLSALVIGVAAIVTSLAPGVAQPVAARDGATFVSLVNEYRADVSLSPVRLHSAIDQIAIERADQLAADRELGHDMTYVKERLADLGICWQQLGEIVAWNTASSSERVARFVTQWYNSDGHRAIMLGSGYTHAGGSWKTGSDGHHYAAMVFVKICGAEPAPVTYGGFTDISDSKFRDDIVWLVERGITTGCAVDRFCPDLLVARDQMATFLARAKGLPAATKDWFTDDNVDAHQDSINRIADAGVTRGCGHRVYCPDEAVTRGQMASFLARAFALPATSRDYFTDDDWSVHEDAINRMAAAGITLGCDTNRFCPRASVKREQMAAFLHRAYD
jgi:uncharacterized protein YkwD